MSNHIKERDIQKEIGIARYEEEIGCFKYSDAMLLDIYQVNTKDMVSGDVDDIEMDCYRWAKFYKTYEEDIKIISLNFPCNTAQSQEFWKKRLEQNKNPLFTEMLETKLQELIYREKHTTSREFYVMFWFKDEQERLDRIRQVESTLGIGTSRILRTLTQDKKEKVLFKLGNKNSIIF
ncbi:MAG: hypothetical protein ACK5MN_00455 [Lachnospiraceae bacterium]